MIYKRLSFNCLSAAAVLMLAIAAPAQVAKDQLITVLNPAVTEKLAERVALAPRLDTLNGKTIYLVDMNYEGFGPAAAIEEMQRWLSSNIPGVKAIYKLKGGSYVLDDPALWKEIAANKGNAVIFGVAG